MTATNRFNHYISTHFTGCLLLAQMLDPHRGRELRFYQVPGEWELVGLTDGTDSFMVPTTTADPTSTKLRKILEDLRNGKQPEISPTLRRRPVAAPPSTDPAANAPRLISRRLISQSATPAPSSMPRRTVRA